MPGSELGEVGQMAALAGGEPLWGLARNAEDPAPNHPHCFHPPGWLPGKPCRLTLPMECDFPGLRRWFLQGPHPLRLLPRVVAVSGSCPGGVLGRNTVQTRGR